jgi:cellulose synthase/poly-beta-1,6-N-acetylglucosamine synthase-like glycosyltransferase
LTEFLFNISLLVLVYVYAGYPVFCLIWGAVFRRSVMSSPIRPRVTIITAAYNEAECIGETVRNKLVLDYPPELVEIIVVSDESTDGTDDIVKAIADETDGNRVTLLRQSPRAGKTAALNLATARAQGEILVFSDANSLYAPDALDKLMKGFADPEVGYVTGRMVYKAADGSLTGDGCSAYMKYENFLRTLETNMGSVVGVDGGIDAVRAANYVQMREDQQPDFVLPLSVVQNGLRVVYAPDALNYEDVLTDPDSEFKMRVRVSLRAWHSLRDKSELLNVMRYGIFAWQLFSHKWLRYLAPIFQILLLVTNIALADKGGQWGDLMRVQIVFYSLAAIGHFSRGRSLPTIIGFPYYLCLLNGAAGVALFKFLAGQKQVLWTPRN